MKIMVNPIQWFRRLNPVAAQRRKSGSTARRREMGESLLHLNALGFRPKTIIDVGVAERTQGLYGPFPDAYYLLIEPIAEFENDLKRITSKCKGEYVLAAAGPKRGEIDINVHSDLSASSLLKETEGSFADGLVRKVPMVRIDDLCEEKRLSGPFLIKVDVQGGEIMVLDGAQKVLADTEAVFLEVLFFRLFENGPEFYEIVHYMRERGFVVYDLVGGANRTLDGALEQIDVCFVKEDGMFRQHHVNMTRDEREKKLRKDELRWQSKRKG